MGEQKVMVPLVLVRKEVSHIKVERRAVKGGYSTRQERGAGPEGREQYTSLLY